MSNGTISSISVEELKTHLDSDKNICLIDVREPHEWDEARIPGATHLQKDIITQQIHEVVPNSSHTIYLHCRSGQRSLIAAHALINQGYQQVINVDGGILAWVANGYPIIRS